MVEFAVWLGDLDVTGADFQVLAAGLQAPLVVLMPLAFAAPRFCVKAGTFPVGRHCRLAACVISFQCCHCSQV